MTDVPDDPMKDMHPVKRTIVVNAINVAQRGDHLPSSAVESLGLRVGDDDDSDVGPAGSPVPDLTPVLPEVRHDKPVVPLNGPLGNTAGQPAMQPTVSPAVDPEEPKKMARRAPAAKDE